jgi:actin-binding LIM protein
MKRRLSSSSVENDSEDEEDFGDQDKVDVEKIKRNVQALDKLDKESSIAHILKQNIEESQNKQRLPLHWDPRNASRTPSAKKMPHLRFRYDTPINACKYKFELLTFNSYLPFNLYLLLPTFKIH